MSRIQLNGIIVILILSLFACNTGAPQAASTELPTTQEPTPLPLSGPGPFHIGKRTVSFVDPSRDGRGINITLWYPAELPAGSSGDDPIQDADPDPSGAPYPLILSSTKVANIFAPYLISHGFTWASVDRIDFYYQMNTQMIDQPLDILYALNQAGSKSLEGLDNIIDAGRAGAIGYSFDGYNALAVSGARIDSQYYLAQCPDPDPATEAILSGLSAFSCTPAGAWNEFAAHAGEAITASEDGLWQPITDERIRAVMPMAGEGWWLFGERGLAAVNRPTLIIAATQDDLYPENVQIYEHLGTPDKALISFVGLDHMMIYDSQAIARMAHFATAFFGYHLQGREDLASYYSEDFVSKVNGLTWGVHQGK